MDEQILDVVRARQITYLNSPEGSLFKMVLDHTERAACHGLDKTRMSIPGADLSPILLDKLVYRHLSIVNSN